MQKTLNSFTSPDPQQPIIPHPFPSPTLGLLPFDTYNQITKHLLHLPNFFISILPSPSFRLKFLLSKQKSVLSSSTYILSLKHNNKPIFYCSKQIFGKYIFYIYNTQDKIQQKCYMSRYQNEYKLYFKQGGDKYEIGYFTSESQSDRPKNYKTKEQESKEREGNKFKILLPVNQNLSDELEGVKCNTKKQSEIKWRWCSRSPKVDTLNIEKVKGNLLKLMYIYVSKGDTINDTKMVLREIEDNVWEYFIENPLNIIQGFALAVLMTESSYD